MDYSRIHRLLRIITLVRGAKDLNPKRLAEICEVDERTIYRDVRTLEEIGIPISFDKEAGGYAIRGDFFLPPVDLTPAEAISILLLAQGVGAQEQIAHLKYAGKAVEKLRAILPTAIREIIDETMPRTVFALAKSSNEPTADVYEEMSSAIANRRAVQCRYESPGKAPAHDAETFRLDPYALYWGQRAWYAIGRHHGHDEVRTLKLARFTKCGSLDIPYLIPDDFSLDRHFGQAWRMMPSGTLHNIKLHFDALFSETVTETHWHDSQKEHWRDDGSVEMHFQVDGLEEIVWFVMSYGPHCRVIEPPELRNRVAEMFARAAKLY